MNNNNKSSYEAAYVIMRIDSPSPIEPAPKIEGLSSDDIELARGCEISFTPIRVVWSRDVALSEVKRLNSINGTKGALYFFSHTRVEAK